MRRCINGTKGVKLGRIEKNAENNIFKKGPYLVRRFEAQNAGSRVAGVSPPTRPASAGSGQTIAVRLFKGRVGKMRNPSICCV